MDFAETMKKIMVEQGLNNYKLSRIMGCSREWVGATLKRNTARAQTKKKFFEAVGYTYDKETDSIKLEDVHGTEKD